MKRTISIFSILLFFQVAFSQSKSAQIDRLICDSLNVSVTKPKEEDFNEVKNQLHIDAHIDVSEYKKDTIDFTLTLGCIYVPALSARNIKVEALYNHKFIRELPAFLTNEGFVVIKDPAVSEIRISYDIIGTYFFTYLKEINHPKLFTFHSDYENLILAHELMQIKKIVFQSDSKATQSFVWFDLDTHKSSYNLDRYAITLVDTTLCSCFVDTIGRLKFGIYFVDNNVCNLFKENYELFSNGLHKLLKYAPASETFSIVTAHWSSDEYKTGFGKAFGDYIYCDVSFVSSPKSLLHEAIHVLYPCTTQDQTYGKFFLGESLTEWVAQYITGQEGTMSEIYGKSKLFDLSVNDQDSWGLIYNEGPARLQILANKMSSELLFDAIMSFFIKYRGEKVCYDNFTEHLLGIGFPKDLVNNLDI